MELLGRLICWVQGEHFWHYENEYSICLSCKKTINQMRCKRCGDMFGTISWRDGKETRRCQNKDENRLIPLCTGCCEHSGWS